MYYDFGKTKQSFLTETERVKRKKVKLYFHWYTITDALSFHNRDPEDIVKP